LAETIEHLLFLSSDPISLPCLDFLARSIGKDIGRMTVVTHPDRRTGRGRKIGKNPVAGRGAELGVPVRQVEAFSEEDLVQWGNPDCAVVYAYGKILKKSILNFFPRGCFNIHASPLPRLRGASPLETALALGWSSTEINWMKMVLKMDAGAVGLRRKISLGDKMTGIELRARVAEESVSLLAEAFYQSVRGEITWEEQDESEATYCRKIQKSDGWLDFYLTARELEARIRAFAGWPGASFLWNGERVRVANVEIVAQQGEPGQVISLSEGLTVAAQKDSLRIHSLQRPGKNWQAAADFLRGTFIPENTILPSDASQPLEYRK